MHRPILLALLLLAAAPAAAQQQAPFPGVPWGIGADSVIRLLGPPDKRGPEDVGIAGLGIENLEFVERLDGRERTRYVQLHPELGVILAGYRQHFGMDCAKRLDEVLRDLHAAYPRVQWEAAPPEPYDCVRRPVRAAIDGVDPESGDMISVRMDRGGMEMWVDAFSREGVEWAIQVRQSLPRRRP
jgi:hypothetical protein